MATGLITDRRFLKQRPVRGSRLDFGHPLADGLIGAWIMGSYFSGGHFWNLVTNKITTTINANQHHPLHARGLRSISSSYGSLPVTDATAALTDFACVVRFNNFGGIKGYQRVVSKKITTGFWIGRWSSNAHIWGGGVVNSTDPYGIFVTLTDGQEHQIVNTRIGSTQWIYGDGTRVKNTASCSSAAMSTDPLALGFETGNSNDIIDGYLSYTYLYNRGLQAYEADWLYEEPYAFILPPRPKRVITFTTGTTFQPAWASSATQVIQYNA